MIERLRKSGVVLAAGAALVAGSAGAQPLLVIETAPMRELAPDPLDAGLVEAVSMLPARVRELATEIPGFDRAAAELIAQAMSTVSRPMTLAIVHDPDIAGPTMGYGAVLSFEFEDRASAAGLHEQLLAALATGGGPAPEPSPVADGMMQLVPPDGPAIVFGPREGGGAWRYEFHVGFVDGAWDLIAGADPEHHGKAVAQMTLDMAALTPVVEMVRHEIEQEDEPNMAHLFDDFENAGLIGPDAFNMNLAMSYQDDHVLTTARINEIGKLWSALSLPTGAIDREHFKLVPADAWTASFGRFDLEMLRAIVEKLDEYEVPASQYVEYFAESTGIHLFDDIVAPLGGDAIVYRSESTGGGGLLSSVMLLEVRDRERMLATNKKLTDFANMTAMMIPVAGKYVRIAPWTHDGIDLFSLRFQGVPIPLELTFGYEGNWMVVAPTPQGAIAAVRQIRGQGDDGLGSVRAFTSQLPRGRELYSASFVNAERVSHLGYGTVSLLGSGLANMSRSPWDRSREPGLIVPPYNDLRDALRSPVTWSYWDGSALEVRAVSGRSLIANMVVGLGKSGGAGLAQVVGALSAQAAQEASFGIAEAGLRMFAATDPIGQLLLASSLFELAE